MSIFRAKFWDSPSAQNVGVLLGSALALLGTICVLGQMHSCSNSYIEAIARDAIDSRVDTLWRPVIVDLQNDVSDLRNLTIKAADARVRIHEKKLHNGAQSCPVQE